MPRRYPKYKVIPALMLVYLAVMTYIGYRNYAAGLLSALHFFGVFAASFAVIVLLYFSLRRRERAKRDR